MSKLDIKLNIQILASILFGLFIAISATADTLKGKAPDFTLKSNTGKNFKLSEFRGQVVLLNFWASWCGPCRQEMPLLDKIQQRYSALGFTVLGVNVEEDSSKAKAMMKAVPVSFPILYDTQNTVSKKYKVSGMPSTVMIDRDGNMRYLHKGYKAGDEQQYKKWVKQLIRE
jgi:peroxiredoxin